MHHPKIEELVRRDPRYAYEAYEFVFAALAHTQQRSGRPAVTEAGGPEHHVRGAELLDGVRDLAHREFGLMARTVFRLWGINSTADFGEIVFNLVEAELMSKTPEDNRADFVGVYDLDKALVDEYRIEWIEEEGRR
jgi:uncharacterized repeat protein (TIGR04138 family)